MEIDYNLSSEKILAIIEEQYLHETPPELTDEQHAAIMQSCFPVIKKHRARQQARKNVVKALGTLCVIMMAGIAVKQALLTPQIDVAPDTGGMAAVGRQTPPAALPATVTKLPVVENPIVIPVAQHQSTSIHKNAVLYAHQKMVQIVHDESAPEVNASYVRAPSDLPTNSEPATGERGFAATPQSPIVTLATPY